MGWSQKRIEETREGAYPGVIMSNLNGESGLIIEMGRDGLALRILGSDFSPLMLYTDKIKPYLSNDENNGCGKIVRYKNLDEMIEAGWAID